MQQEPGAAMHSWLKKKKKKKSNCQGIINKWIKINESASPWAQWDTCAKLQACCLKMPPHV